MVKVSIPALLIAVTLLLCGCDDELSTNPNASSNTEEHYRVYVSAIDANTQAHSLHVMDMPADSLLDSVTLSHSAEFFQLTPDNQKIMIRDLGSRRTLIYDTQTLSVVDTFGIMGPFFIDRQRGIILIDSVDWLFQVDPQTFEVVATMQLPTAFGYGYVHEQSNILYISDRTSKLYLIDYVGMQVTDSIVVRDNDGDEVPVWNFMPIPEFKRVYFSGEGGSGVHVYSYDSTDDVILLRSLNAPGNIAFARTDDGRSVFESDPGRVFTGEHGSYNIWSYDVPSNAPSRVFPTAISDTNGDRRIDVGRLLITPDQKCLLATGTIELALLRYDLTSGSSTSTFSFMYPLLPLHAEIGGLIN